METEEEYQAYVAFKHTTITARQLLVTAIQDASLIQARDKLSNQTFNAKAALDKVRVDFDLLILRGKMSGSEPNCEYGNEMRKLNENIKKVHLAITQINPCDVRLFTTLHQLLDSFRAEWGPDTEVMYAESHPDK